MSDGVARGQAGAWVDAASHFEVARAVNELAGAYVRRVMGLEVVGVGVPAGVGTVNYEAIDEDGDTVLIDVFAPPHEPGDAKRGDIAARLRAKAQAWIDDHAQVRRVRYDVVYVRFLHGVLHGDYMIIEHVRGVAEAEA